MNVNNGNVCQRETNHIYGGNNNYDNNNHRVPSHGALEPRNAHQNGSENHLLEATSNDMNATGNMQYNRQPNNVDNRYRTPSDGSSSPDSTSSDSSEEWESGKF